MAIARAVYTDVSLQHLVWTINPLQSLANNNARQITVIRNGNYGAFDMHFSMDVKTGATVSGTGVISLIVASSIDGIKFMDSRTSMGSSYDPPAFAFQPYNSWIINSMPVSQANTAYFWEGSLLEVMPSLPPYMAIIIVNSSGGALDAAYVHKISAVAVGYEYL